MLFGFKSFTQVVLTAYLLFAMAAACVTALAIHTQRDRAAEQVRTDLTEVADTRVGQIAAWRAERMGDAQTLQRSPFLNQVLTGASRPPLSPGLRRTLEEWIDGLSRTYGYSSIYVFDRKLDILAAVGRKDAVAVQEFRSEIQTMADGESVVFLDPHDGEAGHENHMDILVPIVAREAPAGEHRGWMALVVDPEGFLNPLMRTWPYPSRTAETLLADRKGDVTRILTPLRHSDVEGLSLRLAPGRSDLPASSGTLDHDGFQSGRDYRGARVLAVVRHVPGTSWILVAKIDAAEIYDPLDRQAWQVSGILGCLIAVAGALLFLAARAHQKKFERRDALARHYEHLSRSADDVILLVDEDLKIVDTNRRGEELFGYEKSEMVGLQAAVLAAPEVHERLAEMFVRLGRGESVRELMDGVHRDGTRVPVEIHASPIEVRGRRYFQGVLRDMTEWVRARDALQASEARFREVVNRYPGVFVLHDREFRGLYVNAMALAITGFTEDEVMGKRYEDLFPREITERFMPALRTARDTGGIQTVEFEIELGGAGYFFESTCIPVTDESGAVTQIMSFAHDLTERKRMEGELNKRMMALEYSPMAIVITDTAGAIEYVNPKFCESSGYREDELLGQNPSILKSGRQSAEFYRGLWETISAGREWHGEFWNRRKNGEHYAEQASIAPVVDTQGRITHYVATKQDVTEWRKLEDQFRQAQKMEAVGRLAGGVAHDFNNLLTAISGFGVLAQRGLTEGAPAHRYLAEILRAADRAAGLTHQLLAFSRRQDRKPRIIDLNEVMDDMVTMIQRLIGEDVQLESVPSPVPSRILADSGQVEQVILNLVVNARDAMPDGGRLLISTGVQDLDGAFTRGHPEMSPGRHVVLSVRDTGTGMTDDVKDHLFEPFFTTKGPERGTGLGLATTYGIVTQSKGCIEVDTEPGRGTTFRIFFPEASRKKGNAEVVPVLPASWRGGEETVLLAEDNEGVRDLAREVLTSCGYTVLPAENGPEALELAARHPGTIDLLVTDLIMPEMNGRELARLIVGSRPKIKVLYMSGFTADTMAADETAHGDLAFIQKPFMPADLAARVRGTIDGPEARIAA